eukprot:TRINITY_DN62861_c0_g1_i1.p1 TRINITY_DN62861_c0_g1~~TRINITY_DN62861_c0_g1_i1.p1  ORF type:complete len:668 (-),score=150.49 TRINITY_DN62861_c0_g1_i1:213-2216(-)
MAARPDSSKTVRSTSSSNDPVRFADMANFVGLSLKKNPYSKSGGLAKGSVRLNPLSGESSLYSLGSGSTAASTTMTSAAFLDCDCDVKPAVIKSEIDRLRAQQRMEKEELRRLKSCLSDSELNLKKAQRRAGKHREMRDWHEKQANFVGKQIHELQQELQKAEGHPEAAAQLIPARGMPTGWADPEPGTSDKGSKAPTPATGSRAVTPASRAQTPKTKDSAMDEPPDVLPDMNMDVRQYFEEADRRMAKSHTQQRRLQHTGDATSQSAMGFKSSRSASRSTHKRIVISDPDPDQPSEEEVAAKQESYRQQIRKEILDNCDGDARKAFKKMDFTATGQLSLCQLADGISGLGVNWREITGMKKDHELFKLFDSDRDGVVTFGELFGDLPEKCPERVSTPDFLRSWRKTHDELERGFHEPLWQPQGPDAELQILFDTTASHTEAGEQRKWMQATVRRLKSRGKSDARCREIVANHLPRGTGPKDREDVHTFSMSEVKACRKAYNDQVSDHVRKIQKSVFDMKEQRKSLHESRQMLWSVTAEPLFPKKEEEAPAGLKKKKPTEEKKTPNYKAVAEETSLKESAVEELYTSFFLQFVDGNQMLPKKTFRQLCQVLCPTRPVAEYDAEMWWRLIEKSMPVNEDGSKSTVCDFEHFASWYAHSPILSMASLGQ